MIAVHGLLQSVFHLWHKHDGTVKENRSHLNDPTEYIAPKVCLDVVCNKFMHMHILCFCWYPSFSFPNVRPRVGKRAWYDTLYKTQLPDPNGGYLLLLSALNPYKQRIKIL